MDKVESITGGKKLGNKRSLVFLIVVIASTIGLFGVNKYIDKQIAKTTLAIEDIDQKISQLEKEKNIVIYSLIEANKAQLSKLESQSRIPFLMDEVKKIANEFGLILKGFEYAEGNLKLQAFVKSDKERGFAYKQLSHFIKTYRENQKAVFDLNFIDNISGSSNMKLNLSLTLK